MIFHYIGLGGGFKYLYLDPQNHEKIPGCKPLKYELYPLKLKETWVPMDVYIYINMVVSLALFETENPFF